MKVKKKKSGYKMKGMSILNNKKLKNLILRLRRLRYLSL